jgi:REP element-mobilizing transposase RayT
MSKRLIVGVHDQEPRLFTRVKADIESQLKRLASVDFVQISNVPTLREDLDLLIVVSPPLSGESFAQWVKGIEARVIRDDGIWIPCLMIADVDFQDLNAMLQHITNSNWYFDIANPAHLSSLPVRVANLTRISSHIRELRNYDRIVRDLSARVQHLENQLLNFSKEPGHD